MSIIVNEIFGTYLVLVMGVVFLIISVGIGLKRKLHLFTTSTTRWPIGFIQILHSPSLRPLVFTPKYTCLLIFNSCSYQGKVNLYLSLSCFKEYVECLANCLRREREISSSETGRSGSFSAADCR